MSKKKTFIINEDGKCVISIINQFKNVRDEVKERCSKETYEIFNFIERHVTRFGGSPVEINKKRNIKAVAKCDPYDNFDEQTGKRIASLKADWKYHNLMANKYNNMLAFLDKACAAFEELHAMHTTKMINIDAILDVNYLIRPDKNNN